MNFETTSEKQPELITVSNELYPEDSFGKNYFPEVLEGRLRSANFADVPFYAGEKTSEYLDSIGVTTLSDVYHMTADQFQVVPKKFKRLITAQLRHRSETLGERQMRTPHGSLIGATLGEFQGPVPPEDEPDLTAAVENGLKILSMREQSILRKRFGLDDWEKQTLERVARVYGITAARVSQLESRALAQLRRDKIAHLNFENFSTFQHKSVARLVGLTYRREAKGIPPVPLTVIGLSAETVNNLYSHYINRNDFAVNYDTISETATSALAAPSVGNHHTAEYYKHKFYQLLEAIYDKPNQAGREEIATKVKTAIRRYEPYSVFDDLIEEVSVQYGIFVGAVKNMPTREFSSSLSRKAQSQLLSSNYHTFGTLLDVRRDQRSGEPIDMTRDVVEEIGGMAARWSLYLGEIADKTRSATV